MFCCSFLNYQATYRCAVFAEMGSCNLSKIVQNDFLFFYLQTFKAAFLWCAVGVRKSQFHYLCKVVSKNCSKRSCALTFANCIRRSFSKANQNRENSSTNHINPSSKRALLCTSSEYSSQQNCTASSDCFRLVTEVNLSVQILSRKKIQLNKNNHYSEKGTPPP